MNSKRVRGPTHFKEGLHALKGPSYFKEGLCGSKRGSTCFKEDLHALKRAYALLSFKCVGPPRSMQAPLMHAGPLFEGLRAKGLLQRGLMYFEEGLHTSKRVYTLERGPTHFKEPRGPTYFKEGLPTSKRAYVLQRGSSSSCFKEGLHA